MLSSVHFIIVHNCPHITATQFMLSTRRGHVYTVRSREPDGCEFSMQGAGMADLRVPGPPLSSEARGAPGTAVPSAFGSRPPLERALGARQGGGPRWRRTERQVGRGIGVQRSADRGGSEPGSSLEKTQLFLKHYKPYTSFKFIATVKIPSYSSKIGL